RDRNVTGVQTCALPIYGELELCHGVFNVVPAVEAVAGVALLVPYLEGIAVGVDLSLDYLAVEGAGLKGLGGAVDVHGHVLLESEIGRASCRERVGEWGS